MGTGIIRIAASAFWPGFDPPLLLPTGILYGGVRPAKCAEVWEVYIEGDMIPDCDPPAHCARDIIVHYDHSESDPEYGPRRTHRTVSILLDGRVIASSDVPG